MKFNVKNRATHGTFRTIKKFAWFPVVIDNVYIWLEHYEVKQCYKYHFLGFLYWEIVNKKEIN